MQPNEEQQSFLEQKSYSIWQIEFYQKFFNVNTSDVIARIVGSITPTFNHQLLIDRIRPNPDLYGPIWITITLIFSIAITGNVVEFLNNFGSPYTWRTDFHKGICEML
jgi:protein YIPF1/2